MSARKLTQAAASADIIQKSDEPLRRWTIYASQAWGLWEATNDALHNPDGNETIRHLIGRIRDECALMAVVRVSALFDRDENNVSFQNVHRLMKFEDVREELTFRYIQAEPSSLHGKYRSEIIGFMDGFYEAYAKIDWKAHGRLVKMRNIGIAHISFQDASPDLTYGDVRDLIGIAWDLQRCLSLIADGLNTWVQTDTMDRVHADLANLMVVLRGADG